jgi:hypothetical protein
MRWPALNELWVQYLISTVRSALHRYNCKGAIPGGAATVAAHQVLNLSST